MKKLKIAIFCTNEWPTPPPQNIFYAPLWISYWVAEGLAKKGHKVFYFGSKESKLNYAKLVSLDIKAIKYNKRLAELTKNSYLNEKIVNFYEQLMISKIYQMAEKEKFDIIHIHPYQRCTNFAPLSKIPTVITVHDPLEGITKHFLEFTKNIPQIHLISISNSQRKPLPNLNWTGTVYNGIDIKKFKFNSKPENYWVAAGRFVPEKGIDLAIKIAKKAKIKLKLAGGPAQGKYWEKNIKPFLGKNIEYVGMLPYSKIPEFYRKAKGFLALHRWQEPFGLVFVESMACGTPVIAFKNGSAPEIIKNGKTGFIINSLKDAIHKIKEIEKIDRKDCRNWVKENFTIEKMVENYEKVFLKITKNANRNHFRHSR
jgi:glycosyltransferase involved in cell wall biosynthesis